MKLRRLNLLIVAGFLALPVAGSAAPPSRAPRRVLIVHSFGQYFEPFSTTAATFRTDLALRSPDPIEFYEISLETARFEEGDVDQPLADYVRMLREHRPLDLVVPVGSPALGFCARYRDRIFADVPILAASIEGRRVTGVDLGTNATAVTFSVDLVGSIDDILRLLPGTTSVSVIFGNSPLEQYWVAESRREWQVFAGRVEINWLNELPFARIRERVASMPPHSVILLALFDVDAAGVPYEQDVALSTLHEAANVPIFGLFESELGQGIVGGRLVQGHALGVESARAAVRILGGERPHEIAPVSVPLTVPTFDWRELKRWGIPGAQLPDGSVVRFRQLTFWEEHHWRIIALAALTAFETILIVMFLMNRLRLRSIGKRLSENEQDVQELRRELTHAGRVSLLGQVTTSLAHELGQPLGAILRNAEAAELFMKTPQPDLDEVRAILADVRRDGARAGAVIERLRALLRRHDVDMQPLVWSDLVEETMSIVHADADGRGVRLEIETPPDLPRIRGDRVHIQQVLINLVANAMDAVEDAPAGERRITVRARSNGDRHIECAVSDTGPGIPPDRLAGIFDPFVTTKPHGMGMGLPISRTIVEAHGGRLWAANNAERGVTFYFTIPTSAS